MGGAPSVKIVLVPGKKLAFLGIYPDDEIRIAVGPRTRVAGVTRILARLEVQECWFGGLEFPDGFFNSKTLSGKPPKGVKARR
jgi:hypothetical protein